MTNLKFIITKFFLYSFIVIVITIIFSQKGISKENKIIFKIKDKAFTTLDYEERIKYLDFVGNNANLNKEIILNDFISAIIFFEYYKDLKQKQYNDETINQIYQNIINTNNRNNKIYSYEIDKSSIMHNIKIDYIRKIILENILNTNLESLKNVNLDLDILYKFEMKYINFSSENKEKIMNNINNLNIKSFDEILTILDKEKIEYFIKKKEINFIENLDKKIKKSILSNNNFIILENKDKISIIFIDKSFETFEGLIANLYSVRSKNEVRIEDLKCSNLINITNNSNIQNKEYKFTELNNEIKNNLININDFVKLTNNDEFIYIVLCNIKFDKEILNNYNLNKLINTNVTDIEKKFIIKYSKIYNLVRNNV